MRVRVGGYERVMTEEASCRLLRCPQKLLVMKQGQKARGCLLGGRYVPYAAGVQQRPHLVTFQG